uniref:Uncharacterized protein n=1 Tax=Strigamia maritima TaxID=126957 RepID=T1JHD7_STRMM
MASLIKNGILKHLSKFTKNLSADKINVSTLKGEGELTNLELNEEVLMDLLELPVWIRLTKAVCNKVSCKIMWTKLKSVPIYLNLDEVLVEMETCEELRPHSTQTSVPNYSSGGKYGFSDKVFDGMTVRVNSIVVNFNSKAFHASFHLTRLCLDSRTPTWQKSDLRMTRLKEPTSGELLIFKQVEWQTLRLEAKAVQLQEDYYTPLRLITNQARCRIIIKKRLSDCSILGSRLVFILDELLWVVTDSQLRAAAHFANSLSGLIHRATQLSQKVKAARKLESTSDWHNQSYVAASPAPRGHATPVDTVLSRVFSTYDVHETSYHFYSGQIDLHLCDEVTTEGIGSAHPHLSEGGAIQVALENLSIDYYPYHLANGSRKYWLRYKENSTSRSSWVSSLLADFRMRLTELLPGESPKHTPVCRTQGDATKKTAATPTKVTINNYLARLMSMCVVVRVDEFSVFCVSTPSSRTTTHSKCISSDKARLMLPQDMSTIHLEWTQYYYPGDYNLPVPPPNMHMQVNSLSLTFDALTLLWLNAFSLSLRKVIFDPPSTPSPKMDVRVEGLMPRILFIDNTEYPNTQTDRPRKLQLQISRLTVSNSRIGESCGRLDLGKCLEGLQAGELFFCSGFPSTDGDPHPVNDAFVKHSLSSDRTWDQSTVKDGETEDIWHLFSRIQKDLLWQEEKNIWCVHMDPVWADFTVPATLNKPKPRPLPFLDAFPLTLWVHEKPKASLGDIYILAHVHSLINIQLNHYQYLFLLRSLDVVSDVAKQLVTDTSRISGVDISDLPITCAAMQIPELNVSFVMANCQEAEHEGSIDNCESLTPDETNYRRRMTAVANGIRGSTSEHVNLKELGNEGNLSKSRSDSLLDSRSLANGSPTSSSHEVCPLPEEEASMPQPERTTLTDLSDNLSKTLASGSSVMKKGLFSIRSSIDSAITTSKASLQSLDRKNVGSSPDDVQSLEDWETLSIRSDLSSDSDQFMMVHLDNQVNKAEDALFRSTNVASKIEKASEIKETPTSTSSCSIKRSDLVSILSLRIGKIEAIQNSQGHDSVIRILCHQLASEGQSNITWDEFQTKFSARSRGWHELTNGLNRHSCDVRIRHEIGPKAEEVSASAEERGVVTAIISGVNLSLFTSGLVGMPDLIEDEIIPLPMPLKVYLKDIKINLQDDRPPINVTSPGAIPIDVVISKLSIRREADGIFRIKHDNKDVEDLLASLPSPLPTFVSHSASLLTPKRNAATATDNFDDLLQNRDTLSLLDENKQLKMKLQILTKLEAENERLEEIVAMESAKAASAMQRLEEVEEENKSLLATRQVLQQELVALETRHNSFTTHNATG